MADLLLPEVDEDSAPFWAGTREGELRMQYCAGCGQVRFPPRPMCFACQSLASEWRAVPGRGRVWSFVVPHPPLLPAYAELAPYNVIVVELEVDPHLRLVGNLVPGPDAEIGDIDPATIEIGMPVEAVFAQMDDEITLPRWVVSPGKQSFPGEEHHP